MKKFARRNARKNSQAGLTMIELLIAAAVVLVGFMGTLALVLTAIASNNRNRMDSTSTMLAQAVVENISSIVVGYGDGTDNLLDCAGGTAHPIYAALGGAALSGSQIDFSQSSPPTGYHMDYAVCNASSQTTYDVRWNVQQVTSDTYLVTVGVKMKGASTNGSKYFALPVNLRTYIAKS